MRIAYLILCHTDAHHLRRLAVRLTQGPAHVHVFVHVDAKSPERHGIESALSVCPGVTLVPTPVEVWWGGINAVEATWRLLDLAAAAGPFDRYVLLQGLAYPIHSNEHIAAYFERHRHTEFIRAINLSKVSDSRLRWRINGHFWMDRPSILKRLSNRLVRLLNLPLRSRYCHVNGQTWDFFWGNAEWAFTGEFVRELMKWRHDRNLRARFAAVFAADETYFHTILHNSPFAAHTARAGQMEDERAEVMDLHNIVYTEYPTVARVFGESAFDQLIGRPELFARKLSSTKSGALLDRLDKEHGSGVTVG